MTTVTLEALDFQVSITSDDKRVVVSDEHTRKQKQQLRGDTLLQVIKNILDKTSIAYTVKGTTQDWSYSPNGDRALEIWEDGDDDRSNHFVVFGLADDENEAYSIDLHVDEGEAAYLYGMFNS